MIHATNRRSAFAAFRETLLAFTFDIGGLAAGFFVASQLGIFQLSSWAIAVYPAILGVTGVIQGLLTRRLGTALHLGTIHPRFTNNTKSFYRLLSATIITTLFISATMSFISLAFGSVLWGVSIADSLGIILVVMASMSLGLILSLVTAQVGFVTFKRGLDLDIVVYPVMSTVADILITFCFVVILDTYFLLGSIGFCAIVAILLFHSLLVLYIVSRHIGEKDFRRNLQESIFSLLIVAFIANVTGTVLKRINNVIGTRKEIYTIYPALGDTVGDVGSIISFTSTTRLALGLLRPSLSSIFHHAKTVASTWIASIVVFLMLAFIAPMVNGTFTLSTFMSLLILLMLANVLAVFGIVLLSYGLSIITFQKGLDPDNLVIPIESALADTLITVALLVSLMIL